MAPQHQHSGLHDQLFNDPYLTVWVNMAEKEQLPVPSTEDQPSSGDVPTVTEPAEKSSPPPGEPMATEEAEAAVTDEFSTPPGEPMATDEKAEATAAEDQPVSKPSEPPPGPPIGIITKPKIDYVRWPWPSPPLPSPLS